MSVAFWRKNFFSQIVWRNRETTTNGQIWVILTFDLNVWTMKEKVFNNNSFRSFQTRAGEKHLTYVNFFTSRQIVKTLPLLVRPFVKVLYIMVIQVKHKHRIHLNLIMWYFWRTRRNLSHVFHYKLALWASSGICCCASAFAYI